MIPYFRANLELRTYLTLIFILPELTDIIILGKLLPNWDNNSRTGGQNVQALRGQYKVLFIRLSADSCFHWEIEGVAQPLGPCGAGKYYQGNEQIEYFFCY